MSDQSPSARPRKRLTPLQWATVVDIYEVGYMNQRQLAEMFNISTTAIHMGLKKRGAVKGCRVAETLVEVNRLLDERDARRRQAQLAVQACMDRRTAMLDAFFDQLIEADRQGTVAEMGPIIAELRRSL